MLLKINKIQNISAFANFILASITQKYYPKFASGGHLICSAGQVRKEAAKVDFSGSSLAYLKDLIILAYS